MNFMILILLILLFCDKIETIDIRFDTSDVSFGGGCIWTNSSFTIYGTSNSSLSKDLYFNLGLKTDNEEKSAYCRLPNTTDTNNTKMYCSTDVSSKTITLKDTQTNDETGNYYLYFIANDAKGVTQKCEDRNYLIQNLVLLIALIGLLF